MKLKFILLNSGNATITGASQVTAEVVNTAISGRYDTTTEMPIVYIEDIQKIYVDGVFYGTSASDITDLNNAIAANATAIANNASAIADNASAIAANVTAIADNASAIATNATAINTINTTIGTSADTADADGSIYARIAQLVSDLNAEVANRATAVADLETAARAFTVNGEAFGETGAVVIDANEIKIGTTVPAIDTITATSTVTDALSKLQDGINGVSAAIVEASDGAAAKAATALAEALLHTQVTAGTGISVTHTDKTDSTPNIYTVAVDDTIATKTYVDTAATAAYTNAVTDLTGESTDATTALTIYGARNYADSIVNALATSIANMDADHLAVLEQIKNEMMDPSTGQTSIAGTFLDKLLAVGAGFNDIDGGTEGASGTIKNYIDTNVAGLSAAIAAAATSANTSIKSVNGLTGDANGAVVVGATNILMTDYAAATGPVAATDSVLTAVAKVEQHAIDGVSAAAAAQTTANTAVTAAATAQATADAAMDLLTWVIV